MGILSHRLQAGSLKQSYFLAFMKEQMAPLLCLSDVLVLDNAQCHYGSHYIKAV